MSHWFDRLAAWSADGQEEGEERVMTRRQAMGAAAAGAGAVGLLGSPLVSEALGIAGGNSPECKCWDKAIRINNTANKGLVDSLGRGALFIPGLQPVLLGGLFATTSVFLGQVAGCGLCKDDPPFKPPPPKFQPCTPRGGMRLRGDQCGGDTIPEPPATVCPTGTHDCGGSLCCFGSDLCCGSCCCIVDVGCGCCG
jgi:hypothetical protein